MDEEENEKKREEFLVKGLLLISYSKGWRETVIPLIVAR